MRLTLKVCPGLPFSMSSSACPVCSLCLLNSSACLGKCGTTLPKYSSSFTFCLLFCAACPQQINPHLVPFYIFKVFEYYLSSIFWQCLNSWQAVLVFAKNHSSSSGGADFNKIFSQFLPCPSHWHDLSGLSQWQLHSLPSYQHVTKARKSHFLPPLNEYVLLGSWFRLSLSYCR